MTTTAPSSEAWVHRVTLLLAKAESSPYPEEVEALLAKAQELMARHAIDDAVLAAAGRNRQEVRTEIVAVEAPYANPKSLLLSVVADANRCRVAMSSGGEGGRRCTVVGHDADLASVQALYGALSLHAVRTMLRTPIPPHDAPRRFRHAFLLAFAGRIGERLQEASDHARADAEQAAGGGGGVGLILADRLAEVDRAFTQAFPRIRTTRLSASSGAGYLGGRRAADSAGLGHNSLGGPTPALGT